MHVRMGKGGMKEKEGLCFFIDIKRCTKEEDPFLDNERREEVAYHRIYVGEGM